MPDDPFAFQVERLIRRHRSRHDPATVAQVTLQQWLTARHRFHDPFDPELFDLVDLRLGAMPASSDSRSTPGTSPGTSRAVDRDDPQRPVARSVSLSA